MNTHCGKALKATAEDTSMKIRYQRYKYPVALYAAAVLSASAVIVAASKPASQRATEDALPPVISQVKGIEVLSVAGKREGERKVVVIELRNNSGKAVTTIAIESATADNKEASGITSSSPNDNEGWEAIIEPYGTTTKEFPLSYVKPGQPVQVVGAVYADGTEEGDDYTRESMRRSRDETLASMRRRRDEVKAKAKKGGNPQ